MLLILRWITHIFKQYKTSKTIWRINIVAFSHKLWNPQITEIETNAKLLLNNGVNMFCKYFSLLLGLCRCLLCTWDATIFILSLWFASMHNMRHQGKLVATVILQLYSRAVGLDGLSDRIERLTRGFMPASENYRVAGVAPPAMSDHTRPRARLDSDYDNVSNSGCEWLARWKWRSFSYFCYNCVFSQLYLLFNWLLFPSLLFNCYLFALATLTCW